MMMGLLIKHSAMSNVERQRRFRKRHPGYYGRYHRRRKAAADRTRAIMEANAQANTPAAVPATAPALPGPIVHPALISLTAAPALRVLPAPAVMLVIPGLNTIPEIVTLPAPAPQSAWQPVILPIERAIAS